MKFMATFTGNARRTLFVIARTISRQIIKAQMKRAKREGRGEKDRTEIKGGNIWIGEGAVHR